MAELTHHLQHLARDAQFAFGRLIRVSGRTDVEHLRLIPRRHESLTQSMCGVQLGDDLGFKVQAGRQVEVAVRGPGIAIDAAMLAAAVGVD